MNWLNSINTTNLRIVVSLFLAIIYVFVIIGGVLLGKPMQIDALNTLGMFLLGAMGIDAASFIGKRFSDVGYAAAKAQGPPPSTVIAAPVAPVAPIVPTPAQAQKLVLQDRPAASEKGD